MTTVRLTMAQALVRYLAAQGTVCDGREVPLFAGVWAIFGHGNVAGLGEALFRHRASLPAYAPRSRPSMIASFATGSRRSRPNGSRTRVSPDGR